MGVSLAQVIQEMMNLNYLILKGENMKKLSKKITVNGAEQNALFNALKKACYHLANNTSNASENPDVRRDNYYQIYSNLKALAHWEYDRNLKASTLQVDYAEYLEILNKKQALKKCPATLVKTKSKTSKIQGGFKHEIKNEY